MELSRIAVFVVVTASALLAQDRTWNLPPHVVKSDGLQFGFAEHFLPDEHNGASYVPRWLPGNPPTAYKIKVKDQGLYKITEEDLAAAGMPAAQRVGASLALYHLGEPVAIQTTTEGALGAADFLVFYGEGLRTFDSRENCYWLVPGHTPVRMQIVNAPPFAATVDRTQHTEVQYGGGKIYTSTSTFTEWDHKVVLQTRTNSFGPEDEETWPNGAPSYGGTGLGNGIRFLGLDLPGTHAPGPVDVAFRLTARVPGETRVTIGSSTATIPEVIGETNAETVNRWHRTSFGQTVVEGANTARRLREVVIEAPSLRGHTNRPILRDIAVTYPRVLSLAQGPRCFDAASTTGNLKIRDVAGSVYVLDVSDSRRPRVLVGTHAPGEYNFGWNTNEKPTFFALHRSGMPRISGMTKVTPTPAIRYSGRIDFLIVVDSNRFPSIGSLVHRRAAEGLQVLRVSPDEIYDYYGHGIKHPDAIKQMAGDFYHNRPGAPLRYLLLVGDSSGDPHGEEDLTATMENVLPTKWGPGNFEYSAHDQWFGNFVFGENPLQIYAGSPERDYRPEVLVGRFPVRTNAECQLLINKAVQFENAPATAFWRQKVTSLNAPYRDGDGVFDLDINAVKTQWLDPNNISHAVFKLASNGENLAAYQTGIRNAFLDSAFIQYRSHGTHLSWSGFSVDPKGTPPFPPQNLANRQNWPVVAAWSCSASSWTANSYTIGEINGLAEELLLQPGGAVSCIGFSADIALQPSTEMRRFNQSWFDEKRIRLADCSLPAIRGMRYLSHLDLQSFESSMFTLLGDPTLRLNPYPNGADTDGDGMSDAFEIQYGLEPNLKDGTLDPDGDGFTNFQEAQRGQHPLERDLVPQDPDDVALDIDPVFFDGRIQWRGAPGALYYKVYGGNTLSAQDAIEVQHILSQGDGEDHAVVEMEWLKYYWVEGFDPSGQSLGIAGPMVVPTMPVRTPTAASEVLNVGGARKSYGFEFTPQQDGEITSLSVRYDGNFFVRIFDLDVGYDLFSGRLASNNAWTPHALEKPLRLFAGKRYFAAVYIDELARTSVKLLPENFPLQVGPINVTMGYLGGYSGSNYSGLPSSPYHDGFLGCVDFDFVPYAGTHQRAPFVDVPVLSGDSQIFGGVTHGYQFTPRVSGFVVELGGTFSGTQAVRLYETQAARLLASQTVQSDNMLAFEPIAPTFLEADKTYTLAVWAESGRLAHQYLQPPETPYMDFVRFVQSNNIGGVPATPRTTSIQAMPQLTIAPAPANPAAPDNAQMVRRDGVDGIGLAYDSQMHVDTDLNGEIDEILHLGIGPKPDGLFVGDWNGDGSMTLGMRMGNQFFLDHNGDTQFEQSFGFGLGNAEDQYLIGDWNGNGKSGFGVRRGTVVFQFDDNLGYFGAMSTYEDRDVVVANWSGQGDSIAAWFQGHLLSHYGSQTFYLREGAAHLGGDWNRNGTTSPGRVQGLSVQLEADWEYDADGLNQTPPTLFELMVR